ncbi:glycerol dehydratase reactivase beta/small subunit family protein [Konateibacter massiliensis]|uniref:glycerol dehydratase reactivase beta/small subunit family protein n=1 Tax=Konateibacter massiliensis TaxID=2002841 RepID=UPI000C157E52|nr:glycerol dehydratase reactivase beta/small subunit family protein [Konateibacter massiliensis]
MTINKPAIKLYVHSKEEALIKEVCAGMEEEGVPFELEEQQESELDSLSYRAATDSVLGVGIGIRQADVAIQMSPLPKGNNIFKMENPTLKQGRLLGMNAARAVKRMPFKPL